MIEVPVLLAMPPPRLPLQQAAANRNSGPAGKPLRGLPSGCRRGLASSSRPSSPKVLASTTRRAKRAGLCTHHTGRMCLIPGLNDLAANSVRPATQELYLRSLRQLLAWAGMGTMAALEAVAWDLLLEEFLLWIYDREGCYSQASRLLAAVLWGQPHLRGPLRHAFPRAFRCLEGWKRLEPPASRPPVAREVACLVATVLHGQGQPDMGLLVLVLFESYLRPSEALAMAPSQLIEPEQGVAGVRRWLCLVVRPEESERPNKVNEYDHSVPLDLERQQFLVPALVALKRRREGQERLWPFRYVELSRAFNQAVLTLGLVSTGISLYGLRHGGASHDRSMRSRDLKEVQQRGGWRSFTSVRRYEKHGRLGLEWAKLPDGVKLQALTAPDLVLKLFGPSCARSSRAPAASSSIWRSSPAVGTSVNPYVPVAKRSSRLTSKTGRTMT